MDKNCVAKDTSCILLRGLSEWFTRLETPPVIWAARQTFAGENPPLPIIALAYQDGAGVEWWELGKRRYSFPDQHAVVVSAHRGSREAPLCGKGAVWITSLNVAGANELQPLVDEFAWDPFPVRNPLAMRLAYEMVFKNYLMRKSYTGMMRLKAAWLDLLAHMINEAEKDTDSVAMDVPPSVLAALSYMQQHVSDATLTLCRIAAEVSLDTNHFGRLFRRHMRTTPMAYLRHMRIEQSKYMIQATRLRISEVAYSIGFADPLYFSRVFREATGTSPTEFRTSGQIDRACGSVAGSPASQRPQRLS